MATKDEDALLTCVQCGQSKPPGDFHREASRATGRNRRCKECRNARNREHVARNPGRRRETIERWRRDNPDRHLEVQRRYKLRSYGLTRAEHAALLDEQGGCSAICHEAEKDGWDLAVDHDHRTGRVRGLLCRRCNVGLGLLRDDADLVEAAAAYLRATSASDFSSERVGPLQDSTTAATTDAVPATAKAIP